MYLLFTILLLPCSTNAGSQEVSASQRTLQQEDYAVYSAALNRLYDNERIKLIVIANKTEDQLPLKPLFKLKKKYFLEAKGKLHALLFDEDMKAFSKEYPHSPGYIVLSKINYNDRATEAEIEVSRKCGFLCGEGWYMKLIKNNGRWVVQKKELIWQE